jgi:hypothetical protein
MTMRSELGESTARRAAAWRAARGSTRSRTLCGPATWASPSSPRAARRTTRRCTASMCSGRATDPCRAGDPVACSIYGAPPRMGNALVVGISQSGRSPDVVGVVERRAVRSRHGRDHE